jgi:hypothetical protein
LFCFVKFSLLSLPISFFLSVVVCCWVCTILLPPSVIALHLLNNILSFFWKGNDSLIWDMCFFIHPFLNVHPESIWCSSLYIFCKTGLCIFI